MDHNLKLFIIFPLIPTLAFNISNAINTSPYRISNSKHQKFQINNLKIQNNSQLNSENSFNTSNRLKYGTYNH